MIVARFLNFQALGVFRGAHTGRQRIAGIKRHVRDAAALHAVLGPPGACGERLALKETVLMRIGIDQAADRAMLGGHFRLDAAPGMEVARDDDFALYGNAHALEFFVIFRNAIVDVDQRRGDIAVDRIGVVCRELLGLLA